VSFIVCVVLCTVVRLIVVLFCVMYVVCVLCLIVVPLPSGENPFTFKINIYCLLIRRRKISCMLILITQPIKQPMNRVTDKLPNKSLRYVTEQLAN
jgi:hypothetical protein